MDHSVHILSSRFLHITVGRTSIYLAKLSASLIHIPFMLLLASTVYVNVHVALNLILILCWSRDIFVKG